MAFKWKYPADDVCFLGSDGRVRQFADQLHGEIFSSSRCFQAAM